MNHLIDIANPPLRDCLDILLKDQSTGKNIIWATDTYAALGEGFYDKNPIQKERLLKATWAVAPRVEKSLADQQARTKKRAEVFTPAWVVAGMNDAVDADDKGMLPVDIKNDDTVQQHSPCHVKEKDWQRYVDLKVLEITCGEAPFIVSRYDVATGEPMALDDRIGVLDRKLKLVSKYAEEADWQTWARRAVESVYGFEYQGDNLLIARVNVLLTFVDYYREIFGDVPSKKNLRAIAHVISWNFWQMDGLTDQVPLGKHGAVAEQISMFQMTQTEEKTPEAVFSRIKNWRSKKTVAFVALKEGDMGKKLFDYVIGNPPYNEDFELSGDNGKFAKSVYHEFIDGAVRVADKVTLIHPARFLFNAGNTPKAWNQKMLNDPHFKVLKYMPKSGDVFEGTDIKGGVAITYRDEEKDFGPIGVFTAFEELNSIIKKAAAKNEKDSLTSIIYRQLKFDLEKLYEDYPELKHVIGSNGKEKRFRNNAFEKNSVFTEKPLDKNDIKVIGILKNKRAWRYIPLKYVESNHGSLEAWKVILPAANGSGALGEVLSTPLIGEPLIGYTQSFIGIGSLETREEAEAVLKYVKSKFARTLLGVLKITQHNPPEKWKYVPLQDFTPASDIDWSQSVADIDRQLYRKYGLNREEIDFIETHVKEMV